MKFTARRAALRIALVAVAAAGAVALGAPAYASADAPSPASSSTVMDETMCRYNANAGTPIYNDDGSGNRRGYTQIGSIGAGSQVWAFRDRTYADDTGLRWRKVEGGGWAMAHILDYVPDQICAT
ncbi:hypothetical protein CLV63_13114 [Murinocardiopsis flavida]|uniref:Secreted protein n=1 Tax=Murinocardiopsis flavida TaxID=645275 RepID=A0A2P8CR71_9ACTN|nr:hypothetical protein [Murinocardiopsis flavida]PSK87461.1 hypothetical protein CLV63_13114 [Murinocardiopsis flavida]